MQEQLDRFSSVGGQRVCIVLGFKNEEYLEVFPFLNEAKNFWYEHQGLKISVAINPMPQFGQFSSIQSGLKAHKLSENYDGVFVLPVDVPCPEKDVWKSLGSSIKPNIDVCVPTFEEKGGHPVYLSSSFIQKLVELPVEAKDARLDMQIHELSKDRVARVEVTDQKVGLNLDTPEQFKAFSY